jgi:acetylornithine deacetylase/succinyl-diaminopimelate desuccinylase-like protein
MAQCDRRAPPRGGDRGQSGTYDQKDFARIAGGEHCVAYGPGVLELAHQPDE